MPTWARQSGYAQSRTPGTVRWIWGPVARRYCKRMLQASRPDIKQDRAVSRVVT